MLKVLEEKEEDVNIKYTTVRCPNCGQIIGEVKHADGIVLLRIMLQHKHNLKHELWIKKPFYQS